MARGWRTRLVAAVAALAVVPLLAGCVVFKLASFGPQADLIGDHQVTVVPCASGSTDCAGLGSSGVPALPGPARSSWESGSRTG